MVAIHLDDRNMKTNKNGGNSKVLEIWIKKEGKIKYFCVFVLTGCFHDDRDSIDEYQGYQCGEYPCS